MRIVRKVSVESDPDEKVRISNVFYCFWKLLYKSRSGLKVDKVTSNHNVFPHEFCVTFRKKIL